MLFRQHYRRYPSSRRRLHWFLFAIVHLCVQPLVRAWFFCRLGRGIPEERGPFCLWRAGKLECSRLVSSLVQRIATTDRSALSKSGSRSSTSSNLLCARGLSSRIPTCAWFKQHLPWPCRARCPTEAARRGIVSDAPHSLKDGDGIPAWLLREHPPACRPTVQLIQWLKHSQARGRK
jgi:hypothetical protein